MKVINCNAEIWKQNNGINGVWEHIARCTRVCYQSTPNTGESAEDFVRRVILRHQPDSHPGNHLAMLEHGTIYLTVDKSIIKNFYEIRYWNNPYSYVVCDKVTDHLYITTNMRVIVENHWEEDLMYITAPTKHHRRITVSFTTNIGVSREFNRHRVHSMAEESTRYCNYSNPKFGEGITICNASDYFELKDRTFYTTKDWIRYMDIILNSEENPNMTALDWYIFSLLTSEQAYLNMIDLGATPQEARRVLPLATKTQLIHTAFSNDWSKFIDLRVNGISGRPHPDAKAVSEIFAGLYLNGEEK